jgi:hypothetical protein
MGISDGTFQWSKHIHFVIYRLMRKSPLWNFLLPTTKGRVQIVNRTIFFKYDSEVILTDKFIDCVYQIDFKYYKSINVSQINFSHQSECGICVDINKYYFTFVLSCSETMYLNQFTYNLSPEYNWLKLIIDMRSNRMYFKINNTILPFSIYNIPHTKIQIKINGKRHQRITINYIKESHILYRNWENNLRYFNYQTGELANRRIAW